MRKFSSVHPVLPAAIAPLLTAAALMPLRGHVTSANLALGVMLSVVGIAMLGDRVASVVGALSGALWFDFFLTEPYGSFTIHAGSDVLTAILLAVAGLVVGELSLRMQRQRSTRVAREDEIGRVYYAAELAAMAVPVERLAEVVSHELTDLLQLKSCRYEPGVGAETTAMIDHEGIVRMGDLEWDTVNNGLPGGPLVLDVLSAGMIAGRFVLDPVASTPVEPYQLLVAVALADQVGAAAARWPNDSLPV